MSIVMAIAPTYAFASDPAFNYQVQATYSLEHQSLTPSQTHYSYTDPESGVTYEVEVNTFPIYRNEDVQKAHEWFASYKSQHEHNPEIPVPLTIVQEEDQADFEYIHEDFVTNYELVDKIDLKPGMVGAMQNWLSNTRESLKRKLGLEDNPYVAPVGENKKPGMWQRLRTKMAHFMVDKPWTFRGSLAFLRFSGISTASVFGAVYLSGLPLGPSLAVGLGWYGLFTLAVQLRSDLYSYIINNLSLSALLRKMKTGEKYKEALEKNKQNIPLSVFDKLAVFNFTEIPVLGVGALLYWLFLGEPLYEGFWEAAAVIGAATVMATGAQGILDVSVSTQDEKRENEIKSAMAEDGANLDALNTELQMTKLGSAAKFFVVGVLANFAVLLYSTSKSEMGTSEFLPLSLTMVALLGLYGTYDLISAYADKSPLLTRLKNFIHAPVRQFKKSCTDLFSPDPNAVRFD